MFWKKKFKVGDVVKSKIASNPLFPLPIDISGWQGRVSAIKRREVYVEWDSETLRNMPREYLDACEEKEMFPFVHTFLKKHLVATQARDKEQDVFEEQKRLFVRMESIYGRMEPMREYQKWQWLYWISDTFLESSASEQDDSPFILETFALYMYEYEGREPRRWNASSLEEVCLHVVPRKISAEEETFLNYGKELKKFLEFLGEEKILNTKSLLSRLNKISHLIYKNSQDPANWGIAKSAMMGSDFSDTENLDEKELNRRMVKANFKKLKDLSRSASEEDHVPDQNEQAPGPQPVKPNPYRKIGRNDKVSVRYPDGREVRGVKFKTVADDLIKGNCELIKE